MISLKAFDSNTLNWVKPEIDGSLKQARHALEAFAGNPLEVAQMRVCANQLQQVRGTLQMIELHGPAQLAGEMEQLAQALLSEPDRQQEDTYELLMRAILQLPDHLEHLQMGHTAHPQALLSLVNEMRIARGKKALAGGVTFEPDLSVFKPNSAHTAPQNPPGFDIDIRTAARKLRPTFQLALINWHRNPQDLGHVAQLLQVVRRLEEISRSETLIQLWWVAGGLLEALVDGSLTHIPVPLLGQVDRQMKRLIDLGEDVWSVEPPTALIKDLLYHVAQAQSTNAQVVQLKQAFNLTQLIPDPDQAQASNESLGAPNRELMRTVCSVIKEDLAKVKDGLDIFVRGEQPSVSTMEPLEKILRQTAETLGMIGLDEARNLLLRQAVTLQTMQQENTVPDETELVDLAGALLQVEASLNDLESRQATSDDGSKQPAEQGGADYRQVLNVVIKEAKVDLSRVKDAIVSFIVSQPAQHNLLAGVPQLITQVTGSLAMLSEERAALLLGSCKKYIAEDLLVQHVIPDQQQLENLADTIVSIEYYLEALDENRSDRATILDLAQQSITQAGFDPLAFPRTDETPTQAEPLDFANEAFTPIEPVGLADESPSHFTDVSPSQVIDAEPVAELEEVADPLINVPNAPPLLAVSSAPAPLARPAFFRPDGIDDEIIEIFIEEAQEELASIATNLSIWKLHPEATHSLTLVRRSFHTLKGSGRMVGASAIGEFAWAVENMLNRVIDGTVPVTSEVFALVERTQEILPQLIEHFSGGKVATVEIQSLIDSANRMSQPSPVEPLPVVAAPVVQIPTRAVEIIEPVLRMEPSPPSEPVADRVRALEFVPETDEAISPPEFAWDAVESAPTIAESEVFLEGFVAEVPSPDDLSLAWEEAAFPSADEPQALVETPVIHEPPVPVEMMITAQQDVVADIAELAYETKVEYEALPSYEAETVKATLQIDPVLLEIFSREAASHLQVMQSFVDYCQDEPEECRITDTLVRTLHTLHGSAGMAGINDIAVPSGMLEEYAKHLNLHQIVVGPEVLNMLRTSIDLISRMVAALQNPGFERPDISMLLSTISALRAAPISMPTEVSSEENLSEQAESIVQQVEDPITISALPDAQTEQDSEIVEIFLDEAREILDASEIVLQQWIVEQGNHKLLEELQRDLHTLKGGARMAGLSAIGDLSHSLESVITAVLNEQITLSPQLPKLMQQTQDRLVQMLDSTSINLPLVPATELIASLEGISASLPDNSPTSPVDTVPAVTQIRRKEPKLVEAVETPLEVESEPVETEFEDNRVALRPQHEQIRVRADLLDNLVNFAAEISISRSRIEQQMGAFKYNLVEVDQIISRLRGQLRNLEIETEAQILFRYAETASQQDEEFDPLEFDRFSQMQQLSRSLLESVSDLANIEGLLNGLTRESETLLVQQSRVNTDLHEGLMRARMVQFAVLMPRLRRIVRQTCQQLGKEVELRVIGADGQMDRTVLDRIVPSLEHMLRNAIDHGIESPDARRAAGKQEGGQITLRLQKEGSAMIMEISDNGRGLNLPAIRDKAMKRGLLAADADASDNEVMQFILEPGFTTMQEVTQISGRGVGLDVVNSEIKQLNGSLEIASDLGKGTRFIVRLPLTLSINRALLVHVGDELYAIPLTSIERVVQMSYEDLAQLYVTDVPILSVDGHDYQLSHLTTVFSGERHTLSGPKRKHPVLLARAGDHRVALEVDSLLGSREIVIKSVGPQISTIRGITGATILGDGRVVLILDINALVRAGAAVKAVKDLQHMLVCEVPMRGLITAMVVDDSITVRKVTTRLLERHNIQVLTAKDGVDAVTLLQDHIPDIMLLDVEMPRMDGYELATHMRNEERLRHIPIIMITSRTGQKHRDRAMQIGVNTYMGKPYQESELLENIGNLLGERLEVHH
ncbi:MAG: Hpt domain-containing protein [Gammaproteobacteria bacterium]